MHIYRYYHLLLILLSTGQVTAVAEAQSLDSAISQIFREGNRPIVIFFQQGNCVKCDFILNTALRATEDSTFRVRVVPILIIEASRLTLAKSKAKLVPASFRGIVLADDWRAAARYRIPAGKSSWVLPDVDCSSFRQSSLDEAGLAELLKALNAFRNREIISFVQDVSAILEEDSLNPVSSPIVNFGQGRCATLCDESSNTAFVVDMRTGRIQHRVTVTERMIDTLLGYGEMLNYRKVSAIQFVQPVRINQMQLIDSVTVAVYCIVTIKGPRYFAPVNDTVLSIRRIGVVGVMNLGSGEARFVRTKGLYNPAGGYSSVLRGKHLFVAEPHGYKRTEDGRSDYTEYYPIDCIHLESGQCTHLGTVDSVYLKYDLRGYTHVPFITLNGPELYIASCLGHELRRLGQSRGIRIHEGPFRSPLALFDSLHIVPPVTPLSLEKHSEYVHSLPLQCTIQAITGVSDSLLAVAFVVSSDIRSDTATPKYYVQFLHTGTGAHVGTVDVPCDISPGEHVLAMFECPETIEAARTLCFVVQKKNDIRFIHFRFAINRD